MKLLMVITASGNGSKDGLERVKETLRDLEEDIEDWCDNRDVDVEDADIHWGVSISQIPDSKSIKVI